MLKGFFRSHLSDGFRSRSPDRDIETDAARIGKIGSAITDVLVSFENERDGLNRRISEAQMAASVTVGTATDEYVTREPARAEGLASYEAEMRRGRERLLQLENHINNLKFMRAAFVTRFGVVGKSDLSKRELQ